MRKDFDYHKKSGYHTKYGVSNEKNLLDEFISLGMSIKDGNFYRSYDGTKGDAEDFLNQFKDSETNEYDQYIDKVE